MLATVPGAHDRAAVERALAKIESAAGDAAALPVAVRIPTTERVTGRFTDVRTLLAERN